MAALGWEDRLLLTQILLLHPKDLNKVQCASAQLTFQV